MPDRVTIEAFGDPACPWDFAAEGARLKLMWRHGEALEWVHRMVGLSRTRDEYAERGRTLRYLSESRQAIARAYGAVIDPTPASRHVATADACRAVVAVRTHAPAHTALFLRHLRVLGMSRRRYIDEPETHDEAARLAGLEPGELRGWIDDDAVARALEADFAAARDPDAASLAMPERLTRTPEGRWRYTCPSYVMRRGDATLAAPGFQPARVYEALVANLAPGHAPRPLPDDPADVVAWAPHPLSTAEIATVMEQPPSFVREALGRAGARFEAVANDGYWHRG